MIAIAVIALESTAMLGAEHTSQWLRPHWTRFFGAVDNETWETIHWRIRKGGHFIGYGLVGMLFFRSWYTTLRVKLAESRTGYWWRAAGLSMLATIIIASSDELHQFFIPNRTGKLEDVVIDTCGGIFAQMILAAIYFSRPNREA